MLSEDGERILCRRTDSSGPARVGALVVVPTAEHPSRAVLERLAHELDLKDDLDPAWAVRPLEMVRDSGRLMLLLEDPGGTPLSRLLDAPLEISRFLTLAIGMASALGQVHQAGLIHKDVKPANVVVDSAHRRVRFTGFGIASRLSRERQAPEPPETIAGTLAYMAPEQTGRMNRSVDSRSDLYSLGVTFYEMLTGELPFVAADPLEWVHCHIARNPAPPHDRVKTMPRAVSSIVMKLLSKTPEERYQTASGIESDLRRCLTEFEADGRIADFLVGQHDTPDRLLIPEKLYGREREVGALLAAFDRVVSQGAPELVLVAGYSGIGKSSVVNELHKVLVPPRGLFAWGKFDQYKRDIPYSTLAQAFQGLVRPLLSKSDAELAGWRNALLEALDQNGQLMVDLVPDLKFIIGDQPPVPELPPQQAQSRVQLVFRRFIGVFARPEHPLALFLDDLQWLDAATLDLVEDLLIRSDLQNLIVIGAYRDNEVDAAHPLARKLQAIRSAGAKVQEITLAPLARAHVGGLIADALRCDAEHGAPLAQLVQEKTGGNPFFAIQFLSGLADEALLRFDHEARQWSWNLDLIQAQGYTDNVVDLMVGKLARLPEQTQRAVRQLACVGNVADIAMLSIGFGMSEEQVHADLWEAVRQELVEPLKGSYKFVHDRVQEAAYSLIPEASRAPAHLRIGRLLAAQTPPERRQENIFEIVNQLNRGMALITQQAEREQLAELNLIAGRRAKASTAYASACTYLRTGMSVLCGDAWTRRYRLAFDLWLESAECEYLSGNFTAAERLIPDLRARAASKIDKSAAYRIKVDLHVVKSENAKAIESALECLRLFGIDMRPHPAREEVDVEYEKVWRGLAGRPIESLIDLPLMTDPEMQAAMRLLSALFAPAYFTDVNLLHLHLCHMVNLTLRYGTTDASTYAYAQFGVVLGAGFDRFDEAYRFSRLACDLVEKHNLIAYKANTYLCAGTVAPWTQPRSAIAYVRTAYTVGAETGDLPVASYSCNHMVTDRLICGDHLDEIWQEAERGLDFVRKTKFRDAIDVIVAQQRFIQTMRGRTAHFATFSDAAFDEAEFEAQLTEDRMTTMVCWYWILKLQARFLAGDYAAALAAEKKAKALLWSSDGFIQLLNYHFYAALAVAASHETATPDRQEGLSAHLAQLRRWAESCPATCQDKHALVAAEVARLDGRELDAQNLYEQSIRLARTDGLVHHEALSLELAARFYAARGFDQIANLYLRNAQQCYLRWGAHGKVRQLDEMHPHLMTQERASASATMGASVERLDLATVMKVSQAVSGEMVPDKLLDTLMRTALEQAGAERGVLILSRGGEPRIVAESAVSGDTIVVRLPDETVSPEVLPQSVLQHVLRTRESVILDDASARSPFAADSYIRERRARSVLCAPLINQGKLTGALYLENNLAPRVFEPARIAVLKLLASQAAVSLENSRLYRDLAEREARIRRLVDSNVIGIVIWDLDGRLIDANDAFLRMVQYEREDLRAGLRWFDMTPPEWQEAHALEEVAELKATGTMKPREKEYFRKDGSRVPILIGAACFEDQPNQGVAYILDLTVRKRAEEAARQSEQRYRAVQMELAHANRVATVGQLTASIAHEVNQPIAATVANAQAAVRWLQREPPDLEKARRSLARIVQDGERAGEVVQGIRALMKKAPLRRERLEINGPIGEVIELARTEATKNGIFVKTDFAEGLPCVRGDHVQIRQVMLNLIINAIEAMGGVIDGVRELIISTGTEDSGDILVTVRDSGPGLGRVNSERVFDAFYTTKTAGLGMGLSICRSIIEGHGGRMWAGANQPHGAVFQFTLPPSEGSVLPAVSG
ncbi:MAG TPA: AAA family ATPase [Steroidobacteraceae bacterium]|nr:AAA family ATPase [Steroidobacteraceae bacterium]